MAVAIRSSMLATMSTVIVGSWALAYVGDQVLGSEELFRTLFALSGLGVSIILAYWVRSPWSLAFSLVFTAIWFLFRPHLQEFVWIILGCIFFTCFLWHKKHWQLMAAPYKYISILLFIPVLKQDHPYWQVVGTFKEQPKLSDSEVMIKGQVFSAYSIKYGIETFYVPEGQGINLQRQKHLCVTIAVDKSGAAIVKSVVPE